MRLTDIDRSNAGYCSKKVPFSRLGHSIRPCFARKTPDVVSETAITDGRPGAEDPATTGLAAHGEAGGRLTAAATDWRDQRHTFGRIFLIFTVCYVLFRTVFEQLDPDAASSAQSTQAVLANTGCPDRRGGTMDGSPPTVHSASPLPGPRRLMRAPLS